MERPTIADVRRPGSRPALAVCTALSTVVALLPGAGWTHDRAGVADEGVINGSAVVDSHSWTGDSEAGPVKLRRVSDSAAPVDTRTAIHVQRSAAAGTWALALAGLRDPETFFQIGHTYRMRAYVRDVNAYGQRIGILLANANFAHRPTETAEFAAYPDADWHLVTRTFVCTAPAAADTGLYFALPPSGALHWHITGASVQEVNAPGPDRVSGPPTRVLSFAGPAGSAPDTAQWSHEVGGHGWGNDEVQSYTDRTSNARLDGAGHLVITARREDIVGPDGIPRQYTSARLTTRDKVIVAPGSYVEADLQPPVGSGVWPAFWLLGSSVTRVGWPASGELDVLEVVGATPTIARSATHQAASAASGTDLPYGWDEAGGSVNLGHPLDGRTHRYGVYFDGQTVRFYIDREQHMALWAEDALASGRTWPFGGSQFVLLNVAVGGTGDPSDTTFPRSMTVGEISIWSGGTPF